LSVGWGSVGADLVRDSRRFRRDSRIRSAPTLLHPCRNHVGARPAREIAGRARSYRLPGARYSSPVADLVRDSRNHRRDSRIRSPTLPHPRRIHVGARPARDFAGRARSYRLPGARYSSPVADLVRDSRNHRRDSRIRSATLPHPRRIHVRARPAREIAGRARSYRLPGARYSSPVADLVRDSRNHRRDSRMGSAPTPPHPCRNHVGACPAREIAGRARSYRLPGARYSSPVGADLVRDSRASRRGSRMRSAPTLPHPRHSNVVVAMGIASLNAILRKAMPATGAGDPSATPAAQTASTPSR